MKPLNVNLDVALGLLPTTEPVEVGKAWIDPATGILRRSVGVPPVFSDHPDAATISEGANVTFTVASSNTTSRQWQSSPDNSTWSNIAGQTGLTFTITGATFADHNGKYYRCVATGPGGTTNSNSALLTVTGASPPVITVQPANGTIANDGSHNFTVVATGATSYQWQDSADNVSFANLPGATSATFAITTANSQAQNGRYHRCVVTGSGGSVISNSATLTVTPPAFTLHPIATSATEGETAAFSVAGTGYNTLQWQVSIDNVVFDNIAGQTSTTYSIVGVTMATHGGKYYRCVATGRGGTVNSTSAQLTVFAPGILSGITATVALSPQYLAPAWQSSSRATLRVEKGFASGTFADLYPHTDGQLYTAPSGGGQTATAYAGADVLFVEKLYNQVLSSEADEGHATAAVDSSRRCILDIAVPSLPRLRGLVGTQDPAQHATERGYDIGLSIATNSAYCFVTGDQNNPDGFDETYRPIQTDAGGPPHLAVTQNNRQVVTNPGAANWLMRPASLPYTRWLFNGKKTTVAGARYTHGGRDAVVENGVSGATSGTALPARWLGTTQSLNGYAYFLIAITNTEASLSTIQTLGKRLTKLFKGSFAPGEFTLLTPRNNEVIAMNLATQTATIPITLMGEPNTAYEAQHVSGSYAAIGTSDATGYLEGSLPNAPKNNGTLTVRKVGSGTTQTATTVAVGIVIGKWGQSNIDGRGDDVTHTIPTGFLRVVRDVGVFNDTATSKSWLRILQQRLYDTYGCVIASAGYSVGNSYLTRASGSTDAEWDKNNTATSLASAYNSWVSLMMMARQCNWVLGHQGENDAFDNVSKSQYKAAMQALLANFRADWRSDMKLYNVSIGMDILSGIKVNPIRYAQQELWTESPADFPALGSVAHLPVSPIDNVHFSTVAMKEAVVDVVWRHLFGAGRAPRMVSVTSPSVAVITVTCTGGVGPLTISGGEASAPIGWTVTDTVGTKTVTAVSVNGMVITLTLSAALVGAATVKWLSAGTGIGTTLLDSDPTTPLPPEPFEVAI